MSQYRFSEVKVGNSYFASIQRETKFSRYFSLALFIILPFIGAYVGYVVGSTNSLPSGLGVASVIEVLGE